MRSLPVKNVPRATPAKTKAGAKSKAKQPDPASSEPEPNLLAHPIGFARQVLGLELYDWQRRVLADLVAPGAVALRAANGSGKTSTIAAPFCLWHASVFPRSTIVCTAGVWRQVREQLFSSIRKWQGRLPKWTLNETSVTSSLGSRIIGFATDDAGRFEGWHGSPDEPLLMIVDEAKTVKDDIFEAIERCQPQRRLLMSSPGGMDGEFYKAFTQRASFYRTHVVQASDCPHISQEWIDEQISKWGVDHPLVRSMIFAEFAAGGDDYIVPLAALDRCVTNPPLPAGSERSAFCDFAAGGDENVLAIREGNAIKELVAWRDADTIRAVGRFILLFRKYGLEANEIHGDEGGLGRPMCDALREAGWDIHRVNNGAAAIDDESYANRGSEIWFAGAREIERGQIILPDDADLRAQLTSRKHRPNSRGKLQAESKEEMRKRGLPSPDRADAVLGAIACRPVDFTRTMTGNPLHEWSAGEGWMDRLPGELETGGALAGADAGY